MMITLCDQQKFAMRLNHYSEYDGAIKEC